MEIQSPHYEFHDNLHLSPDQVFLFTKDSGHSWDRPVPGILTMAIGMAFAPTLIVQVSQTKTYNSPLSATAQTLSETCSRKMQ